MSKKVQMWITSVSNGIKKKKDETIPILSFSMSGNGWNLKWKGAEDEAPFEVGKEDRGNEVLIDIDFKKQTTL